MTNLPDPLTPPDCDLRSQDWFQFEHKRLKRSAFWMKASDAAKVVSVDFWCESYEQVPAGSLPDDDVALADAAGFGRRGVEKWLAVKTEVMSAWIKCSDGRWYHPTLCEVALKAFVLKLQDRARKKNTAGERAKARLTGIAEFQRRIEEIRERPPDKVQISADIAQISADIAPNSDVTGPDRTGQDSSVAKATGADAPQSSSSSAPTPTQGELIEPEEPPPEAGPKKKPKSQKPEAFIFETGLRLLLSQGMGQQPARRLLGKLKRDYGALRVKNAIKAAMDHDASDAVSWMMHHCATTNEHGDYDNWKYRRAPDDVWKY